MGRKVDSEAVIVFGLIAVFFSMIYLLVKLILWLFESGQIDVAFIGVILVVGLIALVVSGTMEE